jgi:NAD-dependent deacetylase
MARFSTTSYITAAAERSTVGGIGDLAGWIAGSKCTVALTGAGVSTASGLPDFRGPRGIWRTLDPSRFEVGALREDPDWVWRMFVEHFMPDADLRPNPAHLALAELESMGKLCAVLTQNVDGLHQMAGSRNVVELHGSTREAVCTSCGARVDMRSAAARVRSTGRAPRCPECGGLLRPDVVFFGEPLPRDALLRAIGYATASDVFLAVGTSLTVAPANSLPLRAKLNGARLAIINGEPTEMDDEADLVIRGRVEEVLPELVREVRRLLAE